MMHYSIYKVSHSQVVVVTHKKGKAKSKLVQLIYHEFIQQRKQDIIVYIPTLSHIKQWIQFIWLDVLHSHVESQIMIVRQLQQ